MITFYGLHSIARALRNPNYGVYTAGSAVSLIGTWLQRVAVGWLTWQLTESGAWLGIISFANLFPTMVIGPIAGAAADRWDRLRVTKVSQALAMFQAIALFALTVTGHITIWLLLVLTAFLGVVAAFNQPARLALIPSLVPREHLPAAVAINAIVFNLARFLGPAAAGVIILTGGIAVAFAVNAASFTLFLLALSRVRIANDAEPRVASGRNMVGELADGVRYVATHPGIAPILVLMIAVCIGARPVVELLAGFAAEVFNSGADALALLTSSIGVGAIFGGLWLAGRRDPRGLTAVSLLSTLALAAVTILFTATSSLWVAAPALMLSGFCMVGTGIGAQTLIQLAVDSRMRGRVMSLYGLIFRGGPALGALAMGGASEHVGLRWPVAIGAGVVVTVWVWTWARRHRMRHALESGLDQIEAAPPAAR
jgi:predicted MFS family arabinose efflux permease